MIYWILIGTPGYGIRVSIVSILLNMHHNLEDMFYDLFAS